MFYPADKFKSIYEKMTGAEKFNLFRSSVNGGSYNPEEMEDVLRSFKSDFSEDKKATEKRLKNQIQINGFLFEFLASSLKDNSTLLQLLAAVSFENLLLKKELKMISEDELTQLTIELLTFYKNLEKSVIPNLESKKSLMFPPDAAEKIIKESILFKI